MRLCTRLSLCLATAAVFLPVPQAVARASADPSCAGADDRTFPVTAKIHGGPASYEAGGGFGVWYVDLTNTTGTTCAGLHPVVVLVDDKRALTASQPQLEFYDGVLARPVLFESTDENELVGVFDAAGFAGFSVAPGKTVSVKVRLSMTSDAVANQVTANAAVVQRHNEDGDWIGQSNDYRFGIAASGGGDGTRPSGAPPEGTPQPDGTPAPEGSPPPTGTAAPGTGTPAPGTGTPTPGGSATADDPGGAFEAGSRQSPEPGHLAEELARTGLSSASLVLGAVLVLAAVGGTAFLLARGRR